MRFELFYACVELGEFAGGGLVFFWGGGGRDDSLEVEGSGLDHLQKVGEWADFGGEEEDCQVVV